MLYDVYQEGSIKEQGQGYNKRKGERLLGSLIKVEQILHTQTEVKTHADGALVVKTHADGAPVVTTHADGAEWAGHPSRYVYAPDDMTNNHIIECITYLLGSLPCCFVVLLFCRLSAVLS